MARILSKTQSLIRYSLKSQPSILLTINRHRSFKPELVEISLHSSSSSSSATSESETEATINKLEDMIHRVIVQKSTPDWLPFIPGSSFWVPPTCRAQSHTVANFVTGLANHLTEEESLSFVTLRGWPCSSFLIQDAEEEDGDELVEEERGHVQVQVMVVPIIENKSQHEDEEDELNI